MKKFLIIIFCALVFPLSAFSATLKEALKQTFDNNLELQAERKNLEIQQEVINMSRSDLLPSLTLSSTKNFEDTNKLTNQSGGDASITDTDTMTSSIKLEQTLLDGSGRKTEYEKSKLGLNLTEAKLIKKEQEIFLRAIEAYTGLILAYEKLNINEENVNLLQRQFELDNARLSRGQITASDLAQSQSSLAGAQAGYIEAQNNIVTSRLNYENVIGAIAEEAKLKKIYNAQVTIPKNLSEAKKISLEKSPELIIAEIEYGQSELDVKIARSDLSPTAKISLERTYTDDLSATYDEREKDVLQATVSWPFQFGGKNKSNISKNLQAKGMKRLLLENAQKNNTQSVTSSWSTLQSSRSFLQAVQSQVKASEVATEGISFEYESGSGRSTFDVLQSRSNLINAKINLAEAERSYLLAQYRVLKSVGLLNSDYLNLK
ncbi:TolC family protein [Candidatus Pelagibacter communis]|uniref:TolC family protein n=1 Tax=Pelagibacter ubique TaxID=198252 RepID=UPI00065B3F47|nr:TolC family protein [Candidatus Pelagibacter ubique]